MAFVSFYFLKLWIRENPEVHMWLACFWQRAFMWIVSEILWQRSAHSADLSVVNPISPILFRRETHGNPAWVLWGAGPVPCVSTDETSACSPGGSTDLGEMSCQRAPDSGLLDQRCSMLGPQVMQTLTVRWDEETLSAVSLPLLEFSECAQFLCNWLTYYS
jgi:hypothetical protein